MARILIAYSTHEGQTKKIADTLAEEAKSAGHEVDELDVAEDDSSYDFDAYDGFVVGGPIHRMHHDSALVAFVVRHLELLDEKPSAFFSVSLMAGSEEEVEQAEAQQRAQEFFHETGWHPEIFDTVAGALMYTKYRPAMKQAMRLIAWLNDGPTDTSRDYELTDWEGLRRFARDVLATIERGEAPDPETLIDRHMRFYDFSVVREIVVQAPVERVWKAMLETDLGGDPLVNALSQLRILPEKVMHKLRGDAVQAEPERYTFGDLFGADDTPFRPIAVIDGEELVAGAIGQFWKPVIVWRDVDPHTFATFDEPDFARLAISLRVTSEGEGATRIHYEARTAATDEHARRRFKVYWTLIGRFAGLVMARALDMIRETAST